jgi:chromosome segregation ATPase
VADLQALYSEMRDEAASAWREAAPLDEKVHELEEELKRISSEREGFLCQAAEASSQARSLAKELEAHQTEAQQWKARAELCFVYLCFTCSDYFGYAQRSVWLFSEFERDLHTSIEMS